MEDFLLRNATSSDSAMSGLRALHAAIACDATHQKAWYRFGFLLRRQAALYDAAALALEHAISLKPTAAGPAHAEMTLLALDRLVHAETDKDENLQAKKARTHHDEAMRLNPKLALHTLRTVYGDEIAKAFADVLSNAMEARQRRMAEDSGRGREAAQRMASRPSMMRDYRRVRASEAAEEASTTKSVGANNLLKDLAACEASRARRDVLRLRRESEAADLAHEHFLADLAGRSLPPASYDSTT